MAPALCSRAFLSRRVPARRPEGCNATDSQWDDALATRIAADNLFLDETLARRAARIRELQAKHGVCSPASTIDAENALRGRWRMKCERGWLDLGITLAPTTPPLYSSSACSRRCRRMKP